MGKGGKGRARTYSANDMRSMANNPTSSHYKASADNRANQLNPAHPVYAKSRAGTTTSGSSGILFVGEELGGDSCGFCGAGPFSWPSEKTAHHTEAHGLSYDRPGCEPHRRIFSSRAEYEEHRAAEHSE